MLIGQYQNNLDQKGRLVIPSKLRDTLSTTIVINKGLDDCLTIYNESQFENMANKLSKLPSTKKEVRQYVRALLGSAHRVEIDPQGRVLIPQMLQTIAFIDKECMIVGSMDHIEIWSLDKWSEYSKKAYDSLEDIAETLTDFVL